LEPVSLLYCQTRTLLSISFTVLHYQPVQYRQASSVTSAASTT